MADDARALREGHLSHDDAQALISARMDGPLDTERNRQLLAHLAGCPVCAAFATTMEGMTIGFREIPVLPPSPVVARAVRAEVRRTGVFRSFGRWLTSSRGLPLGALGVATVALAIVAASTFGPLADRVAGPQVAAPQASVGGGADSALRYDATSADGARKATQPPNVEVVPTDPPPTVVVVEVTLPPEATATAEGAIEQRPTEVMMAAAVTESAATMTATLEPVPTDTPEATATPAPPTATATATDTATPEPTATGIIVVTAEALVLADTATPPVDQAGDSSPPIKPRDPAAPTVAGPTDGIGGGNDAAVDTDSGSDATTEQAIEARGDAATSEVAGGSSDASGATSLAATDLEPLRFAELETTGTMYDEAGTLVASPDGAYLAVERVDGVFSVLSADGAVIATGYGYNPIWTDDGVVYTVDAVLAEGQGALQAWDAASGGVDYVTGGLDRESVPVFDVPAGLVDGELWHIRYRPVGSPSLELRSLAADEPLWFADDVALVGQNVYLSGGVVYAPTSLGWLRIIPGEQAVPLGGSAFPADEVLVSSDGGQVAFVAGERVLIADVSDPGAAREVGTLGVGGIAWTPYGLAIADGATLTVVTMGGPVVVIADGDGLSAPVWTPDGLTVVGSDGEVRMVPASQLDLYTGN